MYNHWKHCSVCANEFKPEASRPDRAVLYRCVTCTDLGTATKSHHGDNSLHICTSCHLQTTLFHASSHCWAKVFISNQKDAYAYKKGKDWTDRCSTKAQELAVQSLTGYNEGTNLPKGLFGRPRLEVGCDFLISVFSPSTSL